MSLNTPPYAEAVIEPRDKNIPNMPGGQMSRGWTMLFNSWFSALTRGFVTTSVMIPMTGFSIQIPDTVVMLALNPAGVLGTGMVLLPENPIDGQTARVSSTKTITTLTVSSTNATVLNPPTTLVGGDSFGYAFNTATNAWYRMG